MKCRVLARTFDYFTEYDPEEDQTTRDFSRWGAELKKVATHKVGSFYALPDVTRVVIETDTGVFYYTVTSYHKPREALIAWTRDAYEVASEFIGQDESRPRKNEFWSVARTVDTPFWVIEFESLDAYVKYMQRYDIFRVRSSTHPKFDLDLVVMV
jgi:hypothetical protein